MMSLLTLTGIAFGGLFSPGDADVQGQSDDQDFLFEHDPWASGPWASGADVPDLAVDILDQPDPDQSDIATAASDSAGYAPEFETYEFTRGDEVSGFDPKTDLIELEYASALGMPDVSVSDFADGTGASVALNGVVVADIAGAQGLSASDVVLIPT